MRKVFSKEQRLPRATLISVFVCGVFMLGGCAGSRVQGLDKDSEREIETAKTAREDLWVQNERLRLEKAEFQKQITILAKENQRIIDEREGRIAGLREENQLLAGRIEILVEENRRIRIEKKLLEKKLGELQRAAEPLSSESKMPKKDSRALKIKVLSGDGTIESAKEMAGKLRKMGYNINLIDVAPHSNFSRNTVYFASGLHGAAKALVSRLAGKAVLRPLNWPSIFDLIVVTGKRR